MNTGILDEEEANNVARPSSLAVIKKLVGSGKQEDSEIIGRKTEFRNTLNNIKAIHVRDITKLDTLVLHPTLKCLDYFLTEYARALQLEMVARPDIYRNATFQQIYNKMAPAIVRDEFQMTSCIRHACRAAGIPEKPIWVRSYIWYDQPVPKVIKEHKERNYFRGPRKPKIEKECDV